MLQATDVVVIRELGYAVAEFWRQLPYALSDVWRMETDGGGVWILSAQGRIRVEIQALPARRVSVSLSIPVSRATLRFQDGAGDQADAFMRKFDRAFQRGGG